MSISMIGIDHSRASVDIRARFSFTKNAVSAMGRLKRQGYLRCIIFVNLQSDGNLGPSVQEDWEVTFKFLCSEKEVLEEDCREYFITREEGRGGASVLPDQRPEIPDPGGGQIMITR